MIDNHCYTVGFFFITSHSVTILMRTQLLLLLLTCYQRILNRIIHFIPFYDHRSIVAVTVNVNVVHVYNCTVVVIVVSTVIPI